MLLEQSSKVSQKYNLHTVTLPTTAKQIYEKQNDLVHFQINMPWLQATDYIFFYIGNADH